jgi:hypothetical protein
MRFRYQCFLLLLIFFLAISGCGRKTLPIPPNAVIPAPINDLNFIQDEGKVVLSWTYPETTTIHSELGTIESFQIFRAVVPEQDYCETCPTSFTSLAEITFEQALKDRRKSRAEYTERVLRPGHRYIYKVRTKAGWRLISDDSNIVSFAWESPAAAPAGLKAVPGDRSITLSWQKVANLADGSMVTSPIKYQVYRSHDQQIFSPIGELATGLELRDAGLLNDRNYAYKVRAVQNKGTSKVYGITSRIVSETPRDLSAPMPPRNLTASKIDNGVKLQWEKGHEIDIAGYKIYRRSSENHDKILLGETGASQLFFIDRTPLEKQVNIYSVTVFDRARPTNESVFSKELKHESF